MAHERDAKITSERHLYNIVRKYSDEELPPYDQGGYWRITEDMVGAAQGTFDIVLVPETP